MTRVDFYVLPGDSRLDRYQLACRVTRKAHQAGLRVLIHTTSDEEAAHMDRLRDISNDSEEIADWAACLVERLENFAMETNSCRPRGSLSSQAP